MSKTKLLSLLIITLSYVALGQNVNIPDPNFKTALLFNASINTNFDYEIQVSEAASYTGILNINGAFNVSDLTGIEAFTAATGILFGSTAVSTADFSFNNNFEKVEAFPINTLTSLDVSGCANLKEIAVSNATIMNIDVSNNPLLEKFAVVSSNLTSVDLSNNSALTTVNVSNNNLTVCDIANGNNGVITQQADFTGNSNLSCIQIDSGYTPPGFWAKDATTNYSNNCSLSVNDYDTEVFKLYPNPVKDQLYIEANSDIKSYTIISILGEKVIDVKPSSVIDVSQLKSGVYFLKIESEKGSVTKRFIKQ